MGITCTNIIYFSDTNFNRARGSQLLGFWRRDSRQVKSWRRTRSRSVAIIYWTFRQDNKEYGTVHVPVTTKRSSVPSPRVDSRPRGLSMNPDAYKAVFSSTNNVTKPSRRSNKKTTRNQKKIQRWCPDKTYEIVTF